MNDRELAGWVAAVALIAVLVAVFGAGAYITNLVNQLAAGFGL